MNLYLTILHYYSSTATTLSCHLRKNEVELSGGSHVESFDALGPGRWILIQEARGPQSSPELQFQNCHNLLFFHTNAKATLVKVKVSHSILAVGAVGIRVPLYLGHS